MFDQFVDKIKNISDDQMYLVSSLMVFLIFFIVVTVLLIRLRKKHVEYMSDLPLEDGNINSSKPVTL